MSRDRLLIFGALALLLLFGAWWFTVAAAGAGQPPVLAPAIFSIAILAASSCIFWTGLRKRISGLLVIAFTSIGVGMMGIWQWLASYPALSRGGWLLLPAFAGLGILAENQLGIGWRFSNRQGIWLISAGVGLFLILTNLSIQSSGLIKVEPPWFIPQEPLRLSMMINPGQFSLPSIFSFFSWR